MADFMLLMHDDADEAGDDTQWEAYFEQLSSSGAFDGGSSIGGGESYRRDKTPAAPSLHLTGFIRVRASDVHDARRFLVGNPVYENGGTVEIRELPRD